MAPTPPDSYTVTLTSSTGTGSDYTCTAQHWTINAREHAWLADYLTTVLNTPPRESGYTPDPQQIADAVRLLLDCASPQQHPEQGHLLERRPPFPHQHTDGPLTGCEPLDPDD